MPRRVWNTSRSTWRRQMSSATSSGAMVAVGRDPAPDRDVGDVDARVGELVVEHPRVGDLARERDPDAGAQRVRVDRRAAGREDDRAAPGLAHRTEDGTGGGDRAEDAELERAAEVVDGRLEDRLHELAGGQRRVLEHLDGAEAVGQRRDRGREGVGVADVRGGARGGDALALERRREVVELGLRARDEPDGEALAAEAPGDGHPEVRAGSDDHDRHASHCAPPPADARPHRR